ncbi:ephrin-A1 isoform X2 [Cloeon dipterum]|uniref:ephrin-A1 isoform X2 n=1 Tax=Cloeon dipterum TaxID=197152 RepID=UPI00321FC958
MGLLPSVGRRKGPNGACASVRDVTTVLLPHAFFVLVALQTLFMSTQIVSSEMITVFWNKTNPIFRIDNTDHIVDINVGNKNYDYDQANIICPVYEPGTPAEDVEKYIIYNVSKEEYDTCRISNPHPRIIANCDKPNKHLFYTVTFRPFSPQPGGLEFHPGHDYYFISTSSKKDIQAHHSGSCADFNMKMMFKVCCKSNETQPNNTIPYPDRQTPAIVYTPPTTVTYTPPHTPSRATSPPAKEYPTAKPPKKSSDYDKHPNEVLKNEELTLKGDACSRWCSATTTWSLLAATQAVLLLRWR